MDVAYTLALAALFPPLHAGVKWVIDGVEEVPALGPVILASNHISYLDPLALAYVANRRRRRVRFLAKEELFEKCGLGMILRGMQQIPVRRGTPDAGGSLDVAVRDLLKGQCVGVFPEGTISPDLEPMPGKSGTARLAAASGIPVTPIGLWGLHRVMSKGRKPEWRWRAPEIAVIGKAVLIETNEDIHEATDRIMEAICGCVRRAREIFQKEVVQDDGCWWVRPAETAVLRTSRPDERP